MSIGQNNDNAVNKNWNIGFGYKSFRVSDKNVSPLFYVANAGVLSFRFQRSKEKNQWNIEGSIAIGSNQSKQFGQRTAIVYDPYDITGNRDSSVYIVNPDLSFVQASLSYSYYWKLNTNISKMYAGVSVHDNFYYGALGTDTWFFNQFSMMPAYFIEILNNSDLKLSADASISFLSYLLRQPYTLDPSLPENSYFTAYLKTGSKFATINKFQQVNTNIKLSHKLNNGDQIDLIYRFMWMNYSNIPYRNLRAYSNSILISYSF